MSGGVAGIMIESGIEKVLVNKEFFTLGLLEIQLARGKAKCWLSFLILKLPVIPHFKICSVKRTELPRSECLIAQIICIALLFLMLARFSTILERPSRIFRLTGPR